MRRRTLLARTSTLLVAGCAGLPSGWNGTDTTETVTVRSDDETETVEG
ncbi:hypothetical protein [Salinirubrum litoreum]|uniref:Uncharacterized protein n=1 Tax=Salinirubrum litoreum TaxID=1126234 RepID=A0ABD5R974_9EURY|nr:hypothetical protein [Salinirubrum litoreum]